MIKIPIVIDDNHITTHLSMYTAGNVGEHNVTCLSFESFSAEWDNLTKTIVFTSPGGWVSSAIPLDEADEIPIGFQCLDAVGNLKFTVFGHDALQDEKINSGIGVLSVNPALNELGGEEPQVYQDLIVQTIDAKDTALGAATTANEAAASAAEIDAQARAAEAARVIAESARAGFYAEFDSRLTGFDYAINEINHYNVGIGQKYKTINGAVSAWIADGKPSAIVYISKGIYKEKVNLQGIYSNLSFIGEDKKHVIWVQSTGYYPDCPLTISGDCTIKNITFIANIDDNPSYIYSAYSSGNTGAAYALHVDAPNAPGIVLIENCDMISYVNSALGSGTCKDRELRIIACNLYSYSNNEAKSNGALLYHGENANGVTGQKLVARNSYFYSQFNPLSVYLQNLGNTNVEVELVGNTLASGSYVTNDALVTSAFQLGSGFTITRNSSGNNVERMNYSDSSWQKKLLTNSDGSAILNTSDFNDIRSGLFKGNSLLGTQNTPVTGHAFLGIALTYTTGLYTIQYAWDVDANFKQYTRTWGSASWGAWTALPTSAELGYLSGVTSALQTQINAKKPRLLGIPGMTDSFVLTSGYADLMISVNTPNAVIITIPANATSAWPIGAVIPIYRRGTGTVTIAPASGVSIESSGGKLTIANRYEKVELMKLGTDVWVLTGSLA